MDDVWGESDTEDDPHGWERRLAEREIEKMKIDFVQVTCACVMSVPF